MDTKNFLRFASFIPILALNFNLTLADLSSQFGFVNPAEISEEELAMIILQEQAQAIDVYFEQRNMQNKK